ncbi:MAG: group II intron reverse transcriptase/maturase [Magnetococcales bacterium]|nr:group II intron reverse transcriptase/maturase [Magnetococcales bacterium]
MNRPDLFTDETKLFEDLTGMDALRAGFKAVKRNRGSPGVDGVSIEDFAISLENELIQLRKELLSWTYTSQPVRRVEIPKPNGGVRLLGVPCVRDRVVQASLKSLLEPILDPEFSDSSYGFRPYRDQKQAVRSAREIVASGKGYVVDIDLSKFFDRISHDRLIYRLGQKIPDKRILRLIGKTLRSGVMIGGNISPTEKGSVQGSPLSPLLSNVVLDELDKELERRGLSFCRFADDCNIFVSSDKAAHRVMKSITRFIEEKLKLKVNQEKSQVAPSKHVKFLGMTIVDQTIAISKKSMQRAMDKVKELTPRGTRETLGKTIKRINQWYMGWANYYSMTQYPSQLRKIEAHLRRRLRARFVDQKKNRRNLLRTLIKHNVPKGLAVKTAYSNRKRWALSHTFAVERAYPNKWFIETLGLEIFSDSEQFHWYSLNTWIKLE